LTYDQIRSVTSGESDIEKCDKILANYRQQDVVYALMTHLKEREGELKRITEQRNLSLKLKMAAETANQQLQGALSIQRNLLDAKEITIKSLEDKLEKCEAVKGGESRIKELTAEVTSLKEEREKVKDAYHKVLTDRDDTINELKAQIEELNEKVTKAADAKKSSRQSKDEDQIQELESKLQTSEQALTSLQTEFEEMEEVVKRKDWMITSMKQENEDQRHREDNLHTHIATLQQSIDTYESRFMGKGIDVPIVLAKLSDSEARSKELAETMCQMEIQMSVMRMEFRKHGLDLEKIEMDFPIKSIQGVEENHVVNDDEERQPPSLQDEALDGEDNETATLDSILEPYDPFGQGDRDDISLLKQDVKDGIETIMDGGFCRCACARGMEMRDEPEMLDIDAVYTDASDTFDED
jgi:chromosome segregation ATPase